MQLASLYLATSLITFQGYVANCGVIQCHLYSLSDDFPPIHNIVRDHAGTAMVVALMDAFPFKDYGSMQVKIVDYLKSIGEFRGLCAPSCNFV